MHAAWNCLSLPKAQAEVAARNSFIIVRTRNKSRLALATATAVAATATTAAAASFAATRHGCDPTESWTAGGGDLVGSS